MASQEKGASGRAGGGAGAGDAGGGGAGGAGGGGPATQRAAAALKSPSEKAREVADSLRAAAEKMETAGRNVSDKNMDDLRARDRDSLVAPLAGVRKEADEAAAQLTSTAATLEQQAQRIAELEQQLAERTAALEQQQEGRITALEQLQAQRIAALELQRVEALDRDRKLADLVELKAQRDALAVQVAERDAQLAEHNARLAERNAQLAECGAQLAAARRAFEGLGAALGLEVVVAHPPAPQASPAPALNAPAPPAEPAPPPDVTLYAATLAPAAESVVAAEGALSPAEPDVAADAPAPATPENAPTAAIESVLAVASAEGAAQEEEARELAAKAALPLPPQESAAPARPVSALGEPAPRQEGPSVARIEAFDRLKASFPGGLRVPSLRDFIEPVLVPFGASLKDASGGQLRVAGLRPGLIFHASLCVEVEELAQVEAVRSLGCYPWSMLRAPPGGVGGGLTLFRTLRARPAAFQCSWSGPLLRRDAKNLERDCHRAGIELDKSQRGFSGCGVGGGGDEESGASVFVWVIDREGVKDILAPTEKSGDDEAALLLDNDGGAGGAPDEPTLAADPWPPTRIYEREREPSAEQAEEARERVAEAARAEEARNRAADAEPALQPSGAQVEAQLPAPAPPPSQPPSQLQPQPQPQPTQLAQAPPSPPPQQLLPLLPRPPQACTSKICIALDVQDTHTMAQCYREGGGKAGECRLLRCATCAKEFVLTAGEVQYLQRKHGAYDYRQPSHCLSCRKGGAGGGARRW